MIFSYPIVFVGRSHFELVVGSKNPTLLYNNSYECYYVNIFLGCALGLLEFHEVAELVSKPIIH